MAKATFTIIGTAVSCAQCLTLITNGLNSLNGVAGLSADKKANVLMVEYDSDAIDEAGVRLKLRSIGFSKEELYCIC